MPRLIPPLPAVMTGVLGLFMIIAGFGSAIPGFVKDRVPKQFVPIWEWVFERFTGEVPEDTVMLLAHASQWIIACTEWAAGIILLIATFSPARRMAMTNLGVSVCTVLFGTFMLSMFAMHHYDLPRWNQFPAILAWLGVTWTIVWLHENARRNGNATTPR